MAFDPISLALGSLSGMFQTGYGLYQLIHGNKKLNQLQRPEYQVDKGIAYNQQLASQNANQGLGDQSLQIATDASERGLGTTVNSTLATGQGLGSANRSYQNQIDSFKELAFADAQQKMKNQEVLMGANKDLRDENLRAFDYNKAQPYAQLYNRYIQQSNSGSQNIIGGLQQIGSAATGLGGGGNKTENPNGGGADWSGNYGGQSGFQQYSQQGNLNLGQYNWMYGGLPNYSWHP